MYLFQSWSVNGLCLTRDGMMAFFVLYLFFNQFRPTKNGLPGMHMRTLKEGLAMLRKTDKKNAFQFPVPPKFRGLKGFYADVIKNPMDLGTVSQNIDTKYRCDISMCRRCDTQALFQTTFLLFIVCCF